MCASFITAGCSSIGGRRSQEDRIVAVPDLNKYVPMLRRKASSTSSLEPARSFYGVFDGHGGQGCSDFLAKRFHLEVANNPFLHTNPKKALKEVWNSMDALFYETCVQKRKNILTFAKRKMTAIPHGPGITSINNSVGGETKTEVDLTGAFSPTAGFPYDGSTATIVLVVGEKVYVANCGDSSGALVRRDGSVQLLTTDHGTLNQREVNRVEQHGGSVRDQTVSVEMPSPFCCFTRLQVVGKPRAYPGGLLVTRAFGNFHSKVKSLGGTPGVIIPDCEEVLEMTVENDWTEIVLATDGVWDILEPRNLPHLLKVLDGSARSRAPVAPAIDSSRRLDAIKEEGEDEDDDESSDGNTGAREEAKRVEQSYLNSTCARLVLSCTRNSYWGRHRAPADNTSVVILKFQAVEVDCRSTHGTKASVEVDVTADQVHAPNPSTLGDRNHGAVVGVSPCVVVESPRAQSSATPSPASVTNEVDGFESKISTVKIDEQFPPDKAQFSGRQWPEKKSTSHRTVGYENCDSRTKSLPTQ